MGSWERMKNKKWTPPANRSMDEYRRHERREELRETGETGTLMPGFDPDAEWGTEEWYDAKDEWWANRKQEVKNE